MIRKSTKKFRENFNKYERENPDINILLVLLDAILEMMTITDHDDTEKINKLASFTKLLSSTKLVSTNLTGTIDDLYMDADMIDAIYACCVMPILDYFDNKYKDKPSNITSPKEFVEEVKKNEKLNNIHDRNEFKDHLNIDKEIKDKKPNKELVFDNTLNLPDLPSYNIRDDTNQDEESDILSQDGIDYKILFNIIKETGDTLKSLYNESIKNNTYHNFRTTIIMELRSIYNSVYLSTNHPNVSIKILSIYLCELCALLLHKVVKREEITQDEKNMIDISFEKLNEMIYLK